MAQRAAPRADLDRRLRELEQELVNLGRMVEKAIARSLRALAERDLEESRQVIAEDDYIDAKRFEIEDQCIDIIATHQPVARDLRLITAILHIDSELERIGDYAEGIAKISLMMGEEPPLKPLIDIPRMGEKASSMVRRSLEAFVNRDTVGSLQVGADDDEIDALYNQVYHELILFMLRDPQSIQRATYLLWVSHDLERVADRATNIAERVVYLVTGKMAEVNIHKH